MNTTYVVCPLIEQTEIKDDFEEDQLKFLGAGVQNRPLERSGIEL